jgi:hypothetical protein
MKKLAVLAAIAIMGIAASAQVSSIVQLNNFGPPDSPIYYLTSGTPSPATQGVMVQVLAGPVGGALAPIKNTSGVDTFPINTAGLDGYFDGGIGVIPGIATAGGQADFQIRAWVGADFASASFTGLSAKWTQATTSADLTPPNLPPATIAALNIPANVIVTGAAVPEPTTIALGLLGAAALMIRRRK